MASGVLLQGLGNGSIWDQFGNALNNHSVFVYLRGTTTQVQVYSDATLTTPLSQPLLTGASGAGPGGIPGYVAGQQSLDFLDSTTGARAPVEPVAAGDLSVSVVAQVEPYTAPYTVYVNQANGSDANAGNSPGQAYATLAKAINQLQQVGQHPGRIVIITYGAGDLTLSSPVSVVQKMWIEAVGPSAVAIDRNFSTPNGRSVWDAVTTVSSTTVTSATAAFVGGDVNRIVSIYGAGTGGGTYYGFVSTVTDGSHVVVDNATVLARNATTDPLGVKMSIVGDWNRVVTDASMVSGGSVITSATAAWTAADIGTEVVIAGAGRGGQALRSAIKSVSGNTATILGASSATVSSKRCAIRVNFGDMLTYHAGQGGLRNLLLQDTSTGNGSIGAAIKLISDDGGAGSQLSPSDLAFENLRITSQDAAGAWEHIIDVDGSWNQSNGPGVRRFNFLEPKLFGSRRPGETVRIVTAVHADFISCGSEGSAPTSFQQGIVILDPANNGGGRGGPSSQDVNFTGCEGDAWSFYSEGWSCTYIGDRLNAAFPITGRQVIRLGPTSNYNRIVSPNQSTVGGSITALMADEYDAGSNNTIDTQILKRVNSKSIEARRPTALAFETFPRTIGMTNFALGSSGVMVAQAIWLPGGYSLTTAGLLGGTALAWGTGWTGAHGFVGVYDPDLNLFAATADLAGTLKVDGILSDVLTVLTKDGSGNTITSARVPRSGICYIGVLINSGTGGSGFTYPSWHGGTDFVAGVAPVMLGITTATGLTALPNPLGTLTGQTSEVYGGVI